MTVIRFNAIGRPIAKGSMKAVARGVLTSTAKGLKAWSDVIGWEARQHCSEIIDGPVAITAEFRIPRPKSAPKRREKPCITRPDLDKYLRALFDALHDVVYADDSQVTNIIASKRYAYIGEQPGVSVEIRRVE